MDKLSTRFTKGTIKYYRYSASVNETLSMVVNPVIHPDLQTVLLPIKKINWLLQFAHF